MSFLGDTFAESKDENCELLREYFELPKEMVFIGASPFKTLKIGVDGIKKYHSMLIQEKRIRFKKVSCCCLDVCVKEEYGRQCGNGIYAGRWSRWVDVPVHEKYEDMVAESIRERKRKRHEDEQECNRNRKKRKTTSQN